MFSTKVNCSGKKKLPILPLQSVSTNSANPPSEPETVSQAEPESSAEPKDEKKKKSSANGIAWILVLALAVCLVFMAAERFWPETAKIGRSVSAASGPRVTVQAPQPRPVQEKIVHFKPGEPVNTGFMVQTGDMVYFINPTERFKFMGTSTTHIIHRTTPCKISNGGVLVINGFEKAGLVTVRVVPQ